MESNVMIIIDGWNSSYWSDCVCDNSAWVFPLIVVRLCQVDIIIKGYG